MREETILRDVEGKNPSPQYNEDIDKFTKFGDKSFHPRTNEYTTFEGKPEEYWVYFLEIIDSLQHA